jgi:hypothetical protein
MIAIMITAYKLMINQPICDARSCIVRKMTSNHSKSIGYGWRFNVIIWYVFPNPNKVIENFASADGGLCTLDPPFWPPPTVADFFQRTCPWGEGK